MRKHSLILSLLLLGAIVIAGCTNLQTDAFIPEASPGPSSTALIIASPTASAQPSATLPPSASPSPTMTDTPAATGDPEAGRALFVNGANGAPQCSTCHLTSRNTTRGFSVGPNLQGIAERAATRVEGMSATDYLHESIVAPSAYVVRGYTDIMFQDFGELYSAQQIADLLAYLLTL